MKDKMDLNELPEMVQEIVLNLKERYPVLDGCCDALIQSYLAIVNNFDQKGILYLCGNGGSFADAVHIKGELAKSFEANRPLRDPEIIQKLQSSEVGQKLIEELEMGFPVVVLGESHALRSAYENDRDATFHYAQELSAFVQHLQPGILFGISTSGNAENVVAAMTLAKAYGIKTISFTGPKGGQLAQLSDIDWRVPDGDCPWKVQELQLPLYHALCLMIESHYFGK